MITIAIIDNLAKRITGETTITWRDIQTRISHKLYELDVLSAGLVLSVQH